MPARTSARRPLGSPPNQPQDHRVALTARIRRSPYGTCPVLRVSASTPSAWSSGAEYEPSGGVDLCVPAFALDERA